MTAEDLTVVLVKHHQWLLNNATGERANLSKANLTGADLSWANLTRANLSETNLAKANMTRANLFEANLSGANLTRANLIKANLTSTNLFETDLSRADLTQAKGIISIMTLSWSIWVTKTHATIGCKCKTHKEWSKVTRNQAVKMGLPKAYYQSYKRLVEDARLQLKAQRVVR